jgi:hypothetical protein
MRILSIGFPMPGPQIINHSLVTAPSFFDHDAIVINPLACSRVIEEIVSGDAEHKTRDGQPVANAPASANGIALADLLRDRRSETERLLARGGIVVCIAHPDVPLDGITGFPECRRYSWLPAPDDICYGSSLLHRGSGSEIVAVETAHPFARYVMDMRGKLAYHAYFEDRPDTIVFARSAGGAAVGIELEVMDGRVIFLPAPAREPTVEQRYTISSAISEAVRFTLRLASASKAPAWLSEYSLPGMDERRAARDEAQANVTSAQEAAEASAASVDDLEQFTRLLWEEGRYGLEEPVRTALETLGLRVVARDIDSPAEVRADTSDPRERTVVLLEVEGGVDTVGLEGHYRLRRRLEEAIAAGKPRRGLLVINGHRRMPPSERPQQYADSLRVAAETMRYCVATSEQLFRGVRAALGGHGQAARSLRERLISTEGILRED